MTIDIIETIGPHKIIQVRFIRPDGGYHRACYAPGQDLSGAPEEVQSLAAKEHTKKVVDDYLAHVASQE